MAPTARRSTLATITLLGAIFAAACIGDLPPPGPGDDPPPAPVGVLAFGGDGQVTLVWPPVPGATGYTVYWTSGATPATRESGAAIADAASPWRHTGLTNQTTYRYVVTARSGAGEGAPSGEASATPHPPGPVGEVAAQFTLCCATCCLDRAIGYALWVTDAQGDYVDTVVHYSHHPGAPGGYANAALPTWTAAADSLTDGVTEASRYSGAEVAYTWDGRSAGGAQRLEGEYTLWLEITDWAPTTSVSRQPMYLFDRPYVTGATNDYVAGEVAFEYTP